MTRPLLVFIGSSNIGPYINLMASSVDKYEADRIALVNVLDSPSGQQVDFADFANRVLWDTLCGLVEGRYSDRGQVLTIPKNYDAYKKLKHVFGNAHFLHTVNYQFLRDGIEKLKNTYGTDAIVDVSGVPKRVAIDILTACLAVGLSNVMLFELKKPMGGVQALYHALNENDYEHVVLPNWEPLLGNLEFFSARQNRQKLWTVIVAILISLSLTVLYQLGRIELGDGSWFLVGAIVLFGFLEALCQLLMPGVAYVSLGLVGNGGKFDYPGAQAFEFGGHSTYKCRWLLMLALWVSQIKFVSISPSFSYLVAVDIPILYIHLVSLRVQISRYVSPRVSSSVPPPR